MRKKGSFRVSVGRGASQVSIPTALPGTLQELRFRGPGRPGWCPTPSALDGPAGAPPPLPMLSLLVAWLYPIA